MLNRKPPTPLSRACGSARLVGGLFVLLGGIPMLGAILGGLRWQSQVLATLTTVLLVGPGVWYIVAGIFLKRGQGWVVGVLTRVAIAQWIAVALAFLASALIDRWQGYLLGPAILTVFFIPATIAMVFEVRRAARLSPETEGHAFAVKVLGVEEPGERIIEASDH